MPPGRPKIDANSVTMLELRITPPDGEPIYDWKITEDITQLVCYEEGGRDTEKALHYHCYIITPRSKSWILKWVYSIAHCYNGEDGNAVVFTRKPHDNTFGYIAKHGNVSCNHNVTQTTLDQWLAQSEQYKKDHTNERKRDQRLKQSFSKQCLEDTKKLLVEFPHQREPKSILSLILAYYAKHDHQLPTKSVVENLVLSLIQPYDNPFVFHYYAAAFEPRQYF